MAIRFSAILGMLEIISDNFCFVPKWSLDNMLGKWNVCLPEGLTWSLVYVFSIHIIAVDLLPVSLSQSLLVSEPAVMWSGG
jgi:hypothetical protein